MIKIPKTGNELKQMSSPDLKSLVTLIKSHEIQMRDVSRQLNIIVDQANFILAHRGDA